jgi:peroxiredoxin Q/BCP
VSVRIATPAECTEAIRVGYRVGMTASDPVRLAPGEEAPSFALVDQHGETVSLEDFRGRKVLVFFYPEADTPGCTKQSCDLRDRRRDLSTAGADVVGISPDPPDKQLAFDQKYGLGFPLLADEGHAVADSWGTWGEDTAESPAEVVRSSFLVDERGRIQNAWYAIAASDTVPEAIGALQRR